MRKLVDTGAVMNSRDNGYHLKAMSQCPKIVAEYVQRGEDSNYDVVQLLATLDLNVSPQ